MLDVSIAVEGAFGLTWPSWKTLVQEIEDLGFAGLYHSDHYSLNYPPDCPSLELIVALTYAAEVTNRVRLGSMVAPLSMRDPIMLARQAAALDDLSDGRFVLGLGTGWDEGEHTMFGYELGDMSRRFARLEEGLSVVTQLLRSDTPVTLSGQFYRLEDATLAGPQRSTPPPILIGGSGPKRTLPLVARFADIWNAQMVTPDQFRERSTLLDEMLIAAGRKPGDVKRTLNTFIVCARNPLELEQRLKGFRAYAGFKTATPDEIVEELRADWGAIIGTPEGVVATIGEYVSAGISELSIQWPGIDDIEGLHVLANEIVPQLAGG